MKKKILKLLGGTLILATLVINFSVVTKSPESNQIKLSDIELQAGADQENARYAYCQMIGDRKGCKEDPSRTCVSDVFCD